jgi:uncharacterized DUF497 family protein
LAEALDLEKKNPVSAWGFVGDAARFSFTILILDGARNIVHLSPVEFEWDSGKDASNQEKHGIGFQSACALWNDPGLILLASRHPDEPRFLAIGTLNSTIWTAIFTERGDRVRIISVRRARDNERSLYEHHQP